MLLLLLLCSSCIARAQGSAARAPRAEGLLRRPVRCAPITQAQKASPGQTKVGVAKPPLLVGQGAGPAYNRLQELRMAKIGWARGNA